ncbi:response regulator [Alteromonas macleodii]|uniref:response regulator n=1 Tax=Alteromonas macleodii TaxID=28108 RepID=UPI0031406003
MRNYSDCKVLVVDDMSTMRKIVTNLLVDVGFAKEKIADADDGITAQHYLENNEVDFIVTDWNMPKVTGIELLRWVRSHERHKNVPVLMVTAEAKKEQIVEAAQAGVNGYIVKPFNSKTLSQKIAKIFEG